MTLKDSIINQYFDWMYDLVCRDRYGDDISYWKLMNCLHNIEFVYILPNDRNRAEDGKALRYRFAVLNDCEGAEDFLDGPCSVLEMIVALAIRCEESIMDDLDYGDRTSQWFWEMIVSLGLGSMTDNRFNRRVVEDIILDFINRDYEPNGKGGLFTIRNCQYDMRDLEIWSQLNKYLKTIV